MDEFLINFFIFAFFDCNVMCSVLLSNRRMPHENRFKLRAVICFGVLFCTSLLLSFFAFINSAILLSAMKCVNLLACYVVTVVAVFVLYEKDSATKWRQIILTFTVSFFLECIASVVGYLLSSYNVVTSQYLTIATEWCVAAFGYLILGFAYKIKKTDESNMDFAVKRYSDNMFVALSVITGCFVISGVSFFIEREAFPYYLVLLCCGILYVTVMFFVEFAMEEQRRAAAETAMIKLLWERDRKNYELQKETAELINVKCHDLKRKMLQLKVSESSNDKEIKEIENLIRQYETVTETGNDVLNVIIADMFFRCEEAGIQFTYMVDGAYLNMMEDMDIYSLFNNILDNAFEYEVKNIDKDSRFVSLKVSADRKGIYIHEENYFIGEIEIKSGLIETTKKDKNNHGFGIKSIHRVVEKYHGKLNLFVEADMFQLDVFFPFIQNALLYRQEEKFE